MMWNNWWSGDGWWGYMHMFGLGGLIMMIFYVLIVILVVYLLVRLLQGGRSYYDYDGNRLSRKSDPLDILKERYARGELTDEEYDRMKQKLKE
ncbi:SHOCT domain-containing protein [Caldanaerobius polysaccharolyticus]|uniref:SHOCT domain-containing protein n=1 Tax=Caldanaerobius polysaccharolyticus TaxID=44256 RepID=UPI00047E3687|nr:SHOCT domain-containing protein [Caldanaerobius polysaccharolyticus]